MPDKKNKDNWAELKDDAIVVIKGYLKHNGEPPAEDIRRVKVATSVLSSYTRHEQTESAREQTALIVGRELSSNKEEFAAYMRLSIPRLPELEKKAIASGQG